MAKKETKLIGAFCPECGVIVDVRVPVDPELRRLRALVKKLQASTEGKFSVLLNYPDYIASEFPETFYAFVRAKTRDKAVKKAQAKAFAANGGRQGQDLDDFKVELVLPGWHKGV